jgi:hypothetical protein
MPLLQRAASFGNCTCVHGFCPGYDAQLVASTKVYLEGLEQEVLQIEAAFTALEGVQYALCAMSTTIPTCRWRRWTSTLR